ncbi:hypothetical protein K461DRAFT_290318 [Myriangium duriaei CBS 260.36]|uniref:Uncharacterized protein n=1 Tax=Myriangium duriaei CBS 260.36 TaxID=1168546 RepID=A0A9P4JAM0_9PEZI|nr:hypothetical protein K461DRAFT_290318 [Myriangium duriaei CBS 260.36]
MPSIDRDASRDRESRHSHSYSESGRLSVPMWDSSDPDRCPPPLPIPPGSPNLQTKSNASAAIQAAANKLHERARESLGASYLATISPSSSPEKSLIKGAAHRRMQSAHASNAKDLKSYLDGMRTGSPERSTPGAAADYYSSSSSRPETPTRVPPRPILGENTPPSATMRALQNMVVKDETSLPNMMTANIPQTSDEVATQLSKLTTIATNLQQEMASLTRRSKDNAADLIGLKEAAKTRDDEINKSLKDLMTSPTFGGSSSPHLNRSGPFGLGLLDSKAYSSPPHMPRAASHNNLFDADRIGSPSPFSVEGAASVAMLEKIIREMVTKEGQERLLHDLTELTHKSSKMSNEAVVKVNELSEFIKDKSKNQNLMRGGDDAPNNALVRSLPQETAIPGDLKTLLNKIRDSVTSNGGLTAEIKALIRELRGEILGMGRELGRKLDQAGTASMQVQPHEDPARSRQEMQHIVNQSMGELREHMESLIAESARQSSTLIQSKGNTSSEDMYAMVKHALAEHGDALVQSHGQLDFDKEEILTAVRTACDNFKPEIELQQYGLERDEILEVLKEGLAEYRSSADSEQLSMVNKQEVFDAMHEALQSVQMPQPVLDTHTIRAEMLSSIRECLEEFRSAEPGALTGSLDDGSTRELINDAIRTGLAEHADTTSRVMEISRDDLFDAVKAGLDGSSIPFGGFGEQVLQQLHELVDGMKLEFKQYSAANGRDTEQVLDAVKDGLEVLRGQIENYVDRAQDVTGKDEIIDIVRTGLENLREDVRGFVEDGPTQGRKDLLDYIKSEFEHLHIVIGGTPLESRDASDRSDILAAIEGMRSEVGARSHGSDVDAASLEAVMEELSHLRDTLAPLLIKVGAGTDKEDILATIREAIAELPSQPTGGISTDVLEAIRGEFENIQSSITRTGGNRADMEEMLDTIRLGLDDLRSHIDKKMENPEKHILNGEILDALNEGLDNLRSDVTKTLERPVDMTVSYEILDTLKEGLAGLRADMDRLSPGAVRSASSEGNQIVLADPAGIVRDQATDVPAPPAASIDKSDFEKVEVLLAQLQIKVEAMDRNIQDLPAHAPAETPSEPMSREHLTGLEEMLKGVQAAVADLAARERAEVENAVTKADTDAIETLLRNTKSQIEELRFPEADGLASRDQVDAVEAVARVAKDSIDALATRLDENVATKADVAVVEVLASDVKSALEELREQTHGLSEDEESKRLTKADLDVLGVICTEIKDKVLEMVLPDVETLPDKADIEQLQGLVNDLRDGQEKFRETYDKDISVTAQAFDDRRKDTEEIVECVTTIKSLIEEFKQEATDREESNNTNIGSVNEILTGIQDKVEANPAVADDIKAIIESVKTEFEKAHASLDAIQTTHDEHHTAGLDRQAEHKDAIIADLADKVDSRIDELLAKYEEAQKTLDEKTFAQENVLNSTKELADELKLSIDTLGTALTASTSGFTETTEKLSQDSKTVFDRVDDVFNKLDETQSGLKGEHDLTRGEIAKAVEGVTGIQGDLLEHNPKMLVSLKELHALMSQHYEHSQKTATDHAEALKGFNDSNRAYAEDIKTSFSALPQLMPTASEEASEESKAVNAALHEKLDRLLERNLDAPESSMHEKLDRLVEHSSKGTDPSLLEKLEQLSSNDTSPSLQLERLDAIHAQMMATAAEVTAFVTTQTQRIADEHSSQEREAEELALLIEKQQTRKEHLEDDISVLSSEKSELQSAVSSLRTEQESLTSQKSRLNADIQALHTALAIRKEELTAMEAKADALEKRVMEGLMDHSRALLLTKTARQAPSARTSPRRPKGRDLRVISGASDISSVPPSISGVSTVPSLTANIVSHKASRPSMNRNPAATGPGQERRIMSLSQIHHNAVSGRPSLGGAMGPPAMSGARPGLDALKRSQSVRSPALAQPRKSSWSVGGLGNTKRGFTPVGMLDIAEDKENASSRYEDSVRDAEEEQSELSVSRRTSTARSSYAPSATAESDAGSVITTTAPGRNSGGADSFISFSDAGESRRSSSSDRTVDAETESYVSTSRRESAALTDRDDDTISMSDSAVASLIAGKVRERIEAGELDDLSDVEEVEVEVESSVAGTVDDNGLAPEEGQVVLHGQGVHAVDYAVKDDGHEAKMGMGRGMITPADSGLGSDLPTAALGSEFGGYFPERRTIEGVLAE